MGLFFLFIVISGIIGTYRMNKMSKRYKITSGYVNRYGQFAKSSVMYIDYNYIVFNKEYKRSRTLNTDHHEVFVGKYFPVLYDSMDPGVHEILITRSDFVEYGLVPPDSLAWVEKYVRY